MPTSLSTPITLPTGYTNAATLGPIQNLEKTVLTITGGVAVCQFGTLDPSGKPSFDLTEAELPPGTWGFDQCNGIRLRSRDAGQLATLDPCTGYFEDDPDPYNPGNIPGVATTVTGAVNVQHNDALVASQPTLDFEDSSSGTFAWSINNDGPNTRVKVTPPDVVSSFNSRIGAVVPQAGDYSISQITGAVTSVFGRTGAVVATSGDYIASQVTNAADKASAATQVFSAAVSTGPTVFSANGAQIAGVLAGGSGFVAIYRSTNANVFGTALVSDTAHRLLIDQNGMITWGGGSVAGDTNLYRGGASLLQTDVSFTTGPTLGGFTGSQTAGTLINSGSSPIRSFASASTTIMYTVGVTTDSQPRYEWDAAGNNFWGNGSSAPDIELSRSILGSDAGLVIQGTGVGWFVAGGAVYSGAGSVFTTGGGVTWTPDFATGNIQVASVNVSGATTLTVGTPTNDPSAGRTATLTIKIKNVAGSGGTTLTWSGVYSFNNVAKPTSVNFGQTVIVFFVWDSDSSLWRAVGAW